MPYLGCTAVPVSTATNTGVINHSGVLRDASQHIHPIANTLPCESVLPMSRPRRHPPPYTYFEHDKSGGATRRMSRLGDLTLGLGWRFVIRVMKGAVIMHWQLYKRSKGMRVRDVCAWICLSACSSRMILADTSSWRSHLLCIHIPCTCSFGGYARILCAPIPRTSCTCSWCGRQTCQHGICTWYTCVCETLTNPKQKPKQEFQQSDNTKKCLMVQNTMANISCTRSLLIIILKKLSTSIDFVFFLFQES